MSWIIRIFISIIGVSLVHTKVVPKIRCTPDTMNILIPRNETKDVQLEKWGSIPGCESSVLGDSFNIQLALTPELPCGTTRIRNKLTDDSVYYHKLVVVTEDDRRHLFKVSCLVSASTGLQSNIVKRNVLPPEFVEPDYIEITAEVEGAAPIPELSVGVRQSGKLIGDHVTVAPGAPLLMEVYLDTESASTYGILVSYMVVTDNSDKKETIIFNGCTQDQYLFENFKTNNGDFLTAKFRAFKFPESSYLFFRGTVDVCLDKCQGIQCSNGEIGFGRKRRSLPEGADPNKLFEVTMKTFIKVKVEKEESNLESVSRFILEQELNSGRSKLPTLVYEHENAALQSVERSDNPPPPPFIIFETNGSYLSGPQVYIVGIILMVVRVLVS